MRQTNLVLHVYKKKEPINSNFKREFTYIAPCLYTSHLCIYSRALKLNRVKLYAYL